MHVYWFNRVQESSEMRNRFLSYMMLLLVMYWYFAVCKCFKKCNVFATTMNSIGAINTNMCKMLIHCCRLIVILVHQYSRGKKPQVKKNCDIGTFLLFECFDCETKIAVWCWRISMFGSFCIYGIITNESLCNPEMFVVCCHHCWCCHWHRLWTVIMATGLTIGTSYLAQMCM